MPVNPDNIHEGNHALDFILSMANRTRSIDNVVLAATQTVKAGQVLGLVTASGEYAAFDPGAADGSENAAGLSLYEYTTTADPMPIAVLKRSAEINEHQVQWPVGATDPQKDAALAQLAVLDVISRA